jgi:hypothetical protein
MLRPFLCVVLATSLIAACASHGSSSTDSSGSGGGSDGGSGSLCSDFCDLYVKCSTPQSCTFQNPSAMMEACVSECESSIAALSSTDAQAITACMSCNVEGAAGSCTSSSAQCQSACSSAAFLTAQKDWWPKFYALATGDSALVCTDGQSLFAGETCSGSGPFDGSSCTRTCCNGTTCGSTPDVGITCTGTTDGQLTCTCSAGKDKGKALPSVTSCSAAMALNVWATCNE